MDSSPHSDAYLQKVLEQEHGFVFGKPSYAAIPKQPIVYGEVEQMLLGKLESFLLESVVIKDPFDKDHDARRVFQRMFDERYGGWEFLKRKNKLGKNMLLNMVAIPSAIAPGIQQQLATHYHNYGLQISIPDVTDLSARLTTYDSQDFVDKVAIATEIDTCVYAFLETIAKEHPILT